MKNKRTFLKAILLLIFVLNVDGAVFAQEDTGSLYRIGSGDTLDIATWKEPEFTRMGILVRTDGRLSFPLLGEIHVSGLTPMQLKEQIETRLKEYVTNPVVTVSIRASGSQKFYVLGEVVRTGEYGLRKELTILQAFAIAGGFTEWAAKKEIILLRDEPPGNNASNAGAAGTGKPRTPGKDRVEVIRINYKEIVKNLDLSKNIKIQANDTIIVP